MVRAQHSGRRPVRASIAASALMVAIGFAARGTGAGAQSPAVLLVGPPGTPGAQYTSIQAAVNAAHDGDWVLIAPGVYHEKGYSPTANKNHKPAPAGVYITTPNIHLRGMNRDTVIVDGTDFSTTQAAGTAPAGSPACSSDPALQDPGVKQSDGTTSAREGIMVWQTPGVSIENLTSCNSMDNEIWWDNGDGSGHETPMALNGDYISATSTFYKDASSPSAQYGIFTSDVEGPGIIDHSYANNMTDSSYYVGACRTCNITLERPHAENSALGLSTTNAGGNLIVENGEWDLNRSGLVSNAQNNDDFPSPEYGQCVAPMQSPAGAGPNSCYVMRGNHIHDNNNPNTPGVGLTSVGPVGTGIVLAATQHISVVNNVIENNGSWGVLAVDLPDPESGPANCNGGVDLPFGPLGAEVCTFFARGNYTAHNQFNHNGTFGNPTNGDVANEASGAAWSPSDTYGGAPDPNCFTSDTDSSGTVSADPPTLETAPCSPANSDTADAPEVVCAAGFATLLIPGANCPAAAPFNYPPRDHKCIAPAVLTPAGDMTNGVCFLPLSYTLSAQISPTMPDPCAGVPANAFCTAATTTGAAPVAVTATPNTSRGTDRGALIAALALLVAVPGAVMLRRRRRLG